MDLDTIAETERQQDERERAAQRELDAAAAESFERVAELLLSDPNHVGFLDQETTDFIWLVEEREPEFGDTVAYAARALPKALEWATGHTSGEDLEPGAYWVVIAQVVEAADDELPCSLVCIVTADGRITRLTPEELERLGL